MTYDQFMALTLLGQSVHQLIIVTVLMLGALTLKVWGAKVTNKLLYRIFSKKGRIDSSERFNELVGKSMQFFGLMLAIYVSLTILTIPKVLSIFQNVSISDQISRFL